MTPSQRTTHKVIWIVLAIILPLLFILAIKGIPEKAIQEDLFEVSSEHSITNPPK